MQPPPGRARLRERVRPEPQRVAVVMLRWPIGRKLGVENLAQLVRSSSSAVIIALVAGTSRSRDVVSTVLPSVISKA